jgi:hypothetical protein
LGCTSPKPPPAPAGTPAANVSPPPFLVSTEQIAGEFVWRQSITATHPEGTSQFEAVVQKHCGELVVVGFTPFGARAFTIRQRGTQVESEVEVAPPPFPPEAVLYDVHRTFFASLGDAPPDGERSGERDGEEIREIWQDGKLQKRTHHRLDGEPAGAVVIEYGADLGPTGPPSPVKLRSDWFGYALEIVTLDRQEAPCSNPRAR